MNIGDIVCTNTHDVVGLVNDIRAKAVTLTVLWNKPPKAQGCKTFLVNMDEIEQLPKGTKVTKIYKTGDPKTVTYDTYDVYMGVITGEDGTSIAVFNVDGTVSLEFEFIEDVTTKNNKQYTTLGIEPWDIMKADFTKEEFIGFLKGNIIKYCLRKKGSDLQDFEKIEHYARKLQEVLKDE